MTIIKYFTDIMKLIQEEGNAKVTQQISTELLQVPTLKLTFNLASKKEIAVHLIWNRRTESQLLKLTQKKFVRHLKHLRSDTVLLSNVIAIVLLKIITCYSHLRYDPGVDEVLLVEAGGQGLDLQQVLLVSGQVREQHLQQSRTIRMEDPPGLLCSLCIYLENPSSTILYSK